MEEPVRITPTEAREKTKDGSAMLVCAYDDQGKFESNHLEGAVSLSDFRSRLASMPNDQEIIFYCA